MIGRLSGILLEKSPPRLLVDVQGLAYELEVPMFSFYRLPEVGQTVILHTHLVIREDAHLLYGFSQAQERTLFRSLIKVNGIGPKIALSILSGIEPDQFVNCVTQNDTASLVRIPGVGKKMAERLLVEMRDKLEDWQFSSVSLASPASQKTTQPLYNPTDEAIGALIGLGYKQAEARRAVMEVAKEHTTSEAMIRQALRGMLKTK